LNFATTFLEAKQGEKIIRLVTDSAADAQKAREENVFKFYDQGIRLDCIVISSAKNEKRTTIGAGKLGQVFKESDIAAISRALLA
jgi:hypothetical protein